MVCYTNSSNLVVLIWGSKLSIATEVPCDRLEIALFFGGLISGTLWNFEVSHYHNMKYYSSVVIMHSKTSFYAVDQDNNELVKRNSTLCCIVALFVSECPMMHYHSHSENTGRQCWGLFVLSNHQMNDLFYEAKLQHQQSIQTHNINSNDCP